MIPESRFRTQAFPSTSSSFAGTLRAYAVLKTSAKRSADPPKWPFSASPGPGKSGGCLFTLPQEGWRRYPTDAEFLQGLSHRQLQPAGLRH